MSPTGAWLHFLILVSIFSPLAIAVDPSVWLSNFDEFPSCGTMCALKIVPGSNCQTLTNYTCLCEDIPIRAVMTDCIFEQCTGMEIFQLAKLEAAGCEAPKRSRKHILMLLLPAEAIVNISFFLRFYSRKTTIGRFDSDDYIVFLIWFIYILFIAIGNIGTFRAFGVDIWTVEAESLDGAFRLFYFWSTLYLIIMELTKTAIVLFYLRVFPSVGFRRIAFVVIIFLVLCMLTFTGLQIFQCLPIHYNWYGWRGDFGPHKCINVNRFVYAAGATMITQDVIILLLPLPWLVSLNAGKKVKVQIIVLFSMGIFILMTSCVRTSYLVLYARTVNPTWDYTDALLWSGLEVAVSILVINLPAVRILVVKHMGPALKDAVTATFGTLPHATAKGTGGINTENNPWRSTHSMSPTSHVDPHSTRGSNASFIPPSRGESPMPDCPWYSWKCRNKHHQSSKEEFDVSIQQGNDELCLELGDKLKGNVSTMIRVGSKEEMRRASNASSVKLREVSREASRETSASPCCVHGCNGGDPGLGNEIGGVLGGGGRADSSIYGLQEGGILVETTTTRVVATRKQLVRQSTQLSRGGSPTSSPVNSRNGSGSGPSLPGLANLNIIRLSRKRGQSCGSMV